MNYKLCNHKSPGSSLDFYASAILLLLITSCSPLQLSLPENGWKNFTTYQVKGRHGWLNNQKISFADYSTDKIQRSWTHSKTLGIELGAASEKSLFASVEFTGAHQTYAYQLNDTNGDKVRIFCAADIKQNDLLVGNRRADLLNSEAFLRIGVSRKSNLYIQLLRGENEPPWEILLDNEKAELQSRSYTGYIYQRPDKYYTILPLKTANSAKGRKMQLFELAGFEIRDQHNQPVAAVSLLNQGTIYFNDPLPEDRILLAAVCSALLLQQEIR